MRAVVIASAVLVASALPAAASTVYSNDFSVGLDGFTAGAIETAPSGEKLLSNFGSGGTMITISGLAANSAVTLDFTLDAIGSEDGEGQFGGGPDFFNVSFNGSQVFHNNVANFEGNLQDYPVAGSPAHTGAATLGTLGYSGFPGTVQDSTYLLSLAGTANAAGQLVIAFFDLSSEARNNEYYGIDNVLVSGTLAATPIPPALPLFASALGAVGLIGWRRKASAAA